VSKEDPMSKYNINKDRIGKGYVRGREKGEGRGKREEEERRAKE
jgi:hypothetical protein